MRIRASTLILAAVVVAAFALAVAIRASIGAGAEVKTYECNTED